MRQSLYISLGNADLAENKIKIDGKEMDLSKFGYMLIEVTGGIPVNIICARRPPRLETELDILNVHLQNMLERLTPDGH